MIISPSQVDTYEDCNRYWWLSRIMRLPQPPAAHLTFGTILHSVIERWMSATENGRVPGSAGSIVPAGLLQGQQAGSPVDLYPESWTIATERDGSTAEVTPTEARLIQRLVSEAIESGILQRGQSATLERKLLLPVIDGMQLTGYIDLYRPADGVRPLPMIEDHKSYGKGSVRFLKREDPKSPNYLGANQQLKTYAWASSEMDEWDGDVRVRHNQFPKFPGREVSAVEATITRKEVEEHGEYLRDTARRMLRTSKVKEWADVPGPKDTGKCSFWYGKPCPFSGICGRTETPGAYQERITKLLAQHGGKPRLDLPLSTPRNRGKAKEANVDIFEKAKQQRDARTQRQAMAAGVEAPAINGSIEPAEPAEPAEAPGLAHGAPWANPDCKACKGRGMMTRGTACPICDNTAKRAGKITSMAYIVEVDEDGKGVAVARAESVEDLEAKGLPLEWFEAAPAAAPPPQQPWAPEAGPAAPPPAAQAAPEPEPAPAPVLPKRGRGRPRKAPVEQAPAEPAPAAAPTKGPGRPSVGLTIMVGAFQLRGPGRPVVTSSEVLARFGAELAADMGAASYWELDSFKRRDRLAQKAAHIAGELSRHILVHPGILGNDDEGKLVQALMSLEQGIESVIVRTS